MATAARILCRLPRGNTIPGPYSSRPCGRVAAVSASHTLETLHVGVEDRGDVQGQQLRNDQAAHHRKTQRPARFSARP
jgi:hypothetical protein